MIEVTVKDMEKIRHLFGDWQETLIWSTLDGSMGRAWTDSLERPTAAQIFCGDFNYFAGDSKGKAARELVAHIPEGRTKNFMIIMPQNEEWGKVVEEVFCSKCNRWERYALKKETEFDKEKLKKYVETLPVGYTMRLFDEDIYEQCKQEDWTQDFISQFPSKEDYLARGLGMAVLKDGKIVCGVSSYTIYKGGIEIEIATYEPYRRQGLARACSAGLILTCLQRNLYPSWDASNTWSRDLAVQLGYTYAGPYNTYFVKL